MRAKLYSFCLTLLVFTLFALYAPFLNAKLLLSASGKTLVNNSGQLQGTVTDATTDQALSGVTISLLDGNKTIAQTTSNKQGVYQITNLPSQEYRLEASKVGYVNATLYALAIHESQPKYLHISMSRDKFAESKKADDLASSKTEPPKDTKSKTANNTKPKPTTETGYGRQSKLSFNAIPTSPPAAPVPTKSYESISKAEAYYVDGIRLSKNPSPNPSRKPLELTAIKIPSDSRSIEVGDLVKKHFEGGGAYTLEAPKPSAGTLTAGELSDFKKWDLWQDIANHDLYQYQQKWQIQPMQRYTVQLVTESGFPIADQPVKLLNKAGQTVWQTRSDNTGKAELWANLYSKNDTTTKTDKSELISGKNEQFSIAVNYSGKEYKVKKAHPFHKGIEVITLDAPCYAPPVADIAFIVDATSSMGDEIEYLKAELLDVIARIKNQNTTEELSLRVGSVFYRDLDDEYVTRTSPLSTNIDETLNFIRNQKSGGGGDYPEAIDSALSVAVHTLNWSSEARARLAFVILDAPPHEDPENFIRMQNAITTAAAKGIRIVPIVCSGIKKDSEYLMRSIALATNGSYLFLTDHSRVGNSHIEPTTDKYDVNKLNDLLAQVALQFIKMPNCQIPIDQQFVADSTVVDHIFIAAAALNANITTDTTQNNGNKTYNDIKTIELKLYPNPTYGPLTLTANADIAELYLADVAGKLIEKYQLTGNKPLQLNLAQYPAGVYFIQYPSGQSLKGVKLVLLH